MLRALLCWLGAGPPCVLRYIPHLVTDLSYQRNMLHAPSENEDGDQAKIQQSEARASLLLMKSSRALITLAIDWAEDQVVNA